MATPDPRQTVVCNDSIIPLSARWGVDPGPGPRFPAARATPELGRVPALFCLPGAPEQCQHADNTVIFIKPCEIDNVDMPEESGDFYLQTDAS